MKFLAAVALASFLGACASAPVDRPHADLFQDALFAAPAERISADDVFAPSAAMDHFLASDIAADLRKKGPERGLFDALYGRGQLRLDYDASTTRNAAQAFEARSGNCLSLVILTAAFAKRLQLPVRYQNVFIKEAWSRSEDLNVLNEHVNIVLASRQHGIPDMVIDFIPAADLAGVRTRVLTEANIVAMYMNNRAVELLSGHQLDRAYWWARAAITQDARNLSAFNTLGVIYKAQGNPQAAERVYRHILEIEPDNVIAMGNLVAVLEILGRNEESRTLAAVLAKIQPTPPFHFFDLGTAAMKRGDFAQARAMFTREVQRDAYYDKFHFWLGLAYYGLGDVNNASKQLAIAIENSATREDRALYAEKLARIRAGLRP
jgi:tetratricopeptide (TPR) repeat protein